MTPVQWRGMPSTWRAVVVVCERGGYKGPKGVDRRPSNNLNQVYIFYRVYVTTSSRCEERALLRCPQHRRGTKA